MGRSRKSRGSSRVRNRALLSAGLAILGLGLLAAAQRLGLRSVLTVSEPSKQSGKAYSRMWFDDDILIAVAENGTQLTVDAAPKSWLVDLGLPASAAKWTVSPKAGYLAWAAGSGLQVQPLAAAGFAAPGSISLENTADVKATAFLTDGSLAALLADGTLRWWEPEKLRLLGSWKVPVAPSRRFSIGTPWP